MHQISRLSPHHHTNPLNDSIKSILLKGIKSIVLKVLQPKPSPKLICQPISIVLSKNTVLNAKLAQQYTAQGKQHHYINTRTSCVATGKRASSAPYSVL